MDVLIGAATLAVAFAAIGITAHVLHMLLIPGALVGIGLMLEPSITAQGAVGIRSQPLRLVSDAKPAWPRQQATVRFDASSV